MIDIVYIALVVFPIEIEQPQYQRLCIVNEPGFVMTNYNGPCCFGLVIPSSSMSVILSININNQLAIVYSCITSNEAG